MHKENFVYTQAEGIDDYCLHDKHSELWALMKQN